MCNFMAHMNLILSSWPRILMLLISGFAFWGALSLSIKQYETGIACPVLIIPVCYLITGIFGTIFVATLFHKKAWSRVLFLLALGIGLLISTLATFSNLLSWSACPLTTGGIPMCYLAWGSFIALLVLHLYPTIEYHVRQRICFIMGSSLILLGLVLIPFPVPGSTALIVAGLVSLIGASEPVRKGLQRLRARVNWINKIFLFLTEKTKGNTRTLLDSTRP